MTSRVARYIALKLADVELRVLVNKTQNPVLEEERVKIELERDELLFAMNEEELAATRYLIELARSASPNAVPECS